MGALRTMILAIWIIIIKMKIQRRWTTAVMIKKKKNRKKKRFLIGYWNTIQVRIVARKATAEATAVILRQATTAVTRKVIAIISALLLYWEVVSAIMTSL